MTQKATRAALHTPSGKRQRPPHSQTCDINACVLQETEKARAGEGGKGARGADEWQRFTAADERGREYWR